MDDRDARKKAYMDSYRLNNREKLIAKRKKYYDSHKEELRLKRRRYYQEHKDKIKADAKRTGPIVRDKQRIAVLKHYSGGTMSCCQCGFSDIRALCLDHSNGGGTEHRRKLGNGINVWLWLARHGFPPGYRILCANCNTIKARENREYGSKGNPKSDWRSQLLSTPLPAKPTDRDRRWWTPDQK